jgi:hypothetical protein
MTSPLTPRSGIRLAGGAPIPPAPSFGQHQPVTAAGFYLGATVELQHNVYVPVCAHRGCRAQLTACRTRNIAEGAVYRHWDAAHPGEAA